MLDAPNVSKGALSKTAIISVFQPLNSGPRSRQKSAAQMFAVAWLLSRSFNMGISARLLGGATTVKECGAEKPKETSLRSPGPMLAEDRY